MYVYHEQMTHFAQKTLHHSVRIQDLNSNQKRQLVKWDDIGNPMSHAAENLARPAVAQGKHLEETSILNNVELRCV